MAQDSIELFFSYSHKDEALRDELASHLKPLERRGLISSWHDRSISAGTEWKNEIDSHLKTADIILLLVSADFVSSDYCWDIELKLAMQRHEAGEALVIPIILRPVIWKGTVFETLQALPRDAKAVTTWINRDEAFADVTLRIEEAIKELLKTRRQRRAAKAQASLHRFLLNPITHDEPHREGQPRLAGTNFRLADIENLLSDDLGVEKGVDYTTLQDLLEAKKWREADQETYRIMLEISERTAQGCLRIEDIEKFPNEDLRIIDQLWVKFSSGLFGFSIQKRIYVETGNPLDGKYHKESWERFCGRVGWRKNKFYVNHPKDMIFDVTAPKAHFPCFGFGGGLELCEALFSRRDL